jgi:FixJ family two-component response regulator
VRSHGYVARTFSSAEFLSSAQIDTTTCVIADVQMPNMNGMELQDTLRSQDRGLPIIFITAFPEDAIRARVLGAGAVCYLSKPVDGPTLINHIHGAVVKSGGGDKKRFAGRESMACAGGRLLLRARSAAEFVPASTLKLSQRIQ